ncbi:unnamed protein product, partial [Protopolystoma xenopodis]
VSSAHPVAKFQRQAGFGDFGTGLSCPHGSGVPAVSCLQSTDDRNLTCSSPPERPDLHDGPRNPDSNLELAGCGV